jgi:hypothetical protein
MHGIMTMITGAFLRPSVDLLYALGTYRTQRRVGHVLYVGDPVLGLRGDER